MWPLSDYPFESHFQQVSGYRLHYLDERDKGDKPILFLHGGHFIQEDAPQEIAKHAIHFMRSIQ
jgi:hypothetical protein